MAATANELIRIEGAASMLDVSVRAIYSMVNAGRLTLVRDTVLRRSYLRKSQVEEPARQRLRPAK